MDNTGSIIGMVVYLAFIVVMVASMWKIFTKAGEPGWAAIVPIYNVFILLKIVGKPAWWLVLFFIPVVSIFAAIMVYVGLAKSFGKSGIFAIAFFLLIGFPMLAFGSAQYQGPAA